MPDRLAVARRDYMTSTAAAHRAYSEAMAAADETLETARVEALAAKTRIPAGALDKWRTAEAHAARVLADAIAPVLAEITNAINEARANGTYHMEVAPND